MFPRDSFGEALQPQAFASAPSPGFYCCQRTRQNCCGVPGSTVLVTTEVPSVGVLVAMEIQEERLLEV